MDALVDPALVVEDRRRLVRTTTDRTAEAANIRWLIEGGWRPTTTLLATAGDRLALQRWLWSCGEGDARSELELLEVDEVSDSGRFVRSVIFDADDRAAAYEELLDRYVALGAEGIPQGAIDLIRAWNAHDLVRVRAGMCDGFVLDDHRRTGMGRLEGADRYLEAAAALFALIPDARNDGLYNVAVDRHGSVVVTRTWGHDKEGGEVESFLVALTFHPGEKVSLIELFELEHLDDALARFEQLRSE